MRQLTPAKVARLLKAIHASRSGQEFTASVLLKSCAGGAVKTPEGQALLAAVVAVIGRKVSALKLGHALKKAQGQRHGDLVLSGDYDTDRKRWTYQIEQYGGGPSVGDLLGAMEREQQARAAKIMGKTGAAFLNAVEVEQRRVERVNARFDREEERGHYQKLEYDHRKQRREEERKTRAVEKAAVETPRRIELRREIAKRNLCNTSVEALEAIDAVRTARGQPRWSWPMSTVPEDHMENSTAARSVFRVPERRPWNVFDT